MAIVYGGSFAESVVLGAWQGMLPENVSARPLLAMTGAQANRPLLATECTLYGQLRRDFVDTGIVLRTRLISAGSPAYLRRPHAFVTASQTGHWSKSWKPKASNSWKISPWTVS